MTDDISETETARYRADTPGCEGLIHFDNAGAALQPSPVIAAVDGHLALERRLGGYRAEDEAAADLEGLYDSAAALLNARREEIAVVENATRAWDMAFYGLRLAAGDVILTSGAEYASNYLAFLQARERLGVEIRVAPPEPDGTVSAEAFAVCMDERVRLIALTHAPAQSGAMAPAAAIGAVARAAGVPFLLDACQSAGQTPLDVEQLGCDMLSMTSRKFLRGPRGVGLLYVRDGFRDRVDPPFVDLRAATWMGPDRYALRPDARRFETWEGFVAGRLGLKAAIDYALGVGLARIERRVVALARSLRRELAAIPGVTLRDPGDSLGAIVTFSHAEVDASALHVRLRERGLNNTVVNPATARLDFEARALPPVVRLSVSYYNTEDEVRRCREMLEDVIACA